MCRPMSKNELRVVIIRTLTDRTEPLSIADIKAVMDHDFGAYLECPTVSELISACNGLVLSGQLELEQLGRITFYRLAL